MKKLLTLVTILIVSLSANAQSADVIKATKAKQVLRIAVNFYNTDDVQSVTLIIDGSSPIDVNKTAGEHLIEEKGNTMTDPHFYFIFHMEDGSEVKTQPRTFKQE